MHTSKFERRLILAAAAALLAATVVGSRWPVSAQQPSQPQAPGTFRSGTQIVPLYVTVTDEQRRLVPGLEQKDFEVFDNEKPQSIVFFDNSIQPVTVVVMLDTSASMTASLKLLSKAAEQFLIRMLPEDKGRVGSFNDKIEFFPETAFTSDRDELVAALRELDFGNPTRLYDAIDASMEKLSPIDGRKVVLVFTDGDDTFSKVGLGRVIDRARAEEVMVYAIGLQSEFFNGVQKVRSRPDRGLRKLAEETGGGYFELEKTDDLNSTFTRVAQEIHSQYVVGFAPATLDGKVHKLLLRVKQPGMTARARKTYLAQPGRLSATDGK